MICSTHFNTEIDAQTCLIGQVLQTYKMIIYTVYVLRYCWMSTRHNEDKLGVFSCQFETKLRCLDVHSQPRKFKLFQGRNREMAQALDYYNGQIEALMRAMSVAKIIREDKNPCMIEEGLYLGSLGAANNKVALKSLNLTHILTIARDINPPYPNEFVYKVLSVHDRVDVNISHYFEECFDFIEEAKGQGGSVLVHCFAGKSRSATIVIGYLMKKHGMSHSEAFELVKSKRPVVSPNAGFMTQLENYDKTLKDLNTPNVML